MAKDERWRATTDASTDRKIALGALMLALCALATALFGYFSAPAQLDPHELQALAQAEVSDRRTALGEAVAGAAASPDLVKQLSAAADPGQQRALLRGRIAGNDQIDGLAVVMPANKIVAPKNSDAAWLAPSDALIEARAEDARQLAHHWRGLLETPSAESRAVLLYLALRESALVADKGHVLMLGALPIRPAAAMAPISDEPSGFPWPIAAPPAPMETGAGADPKPASQAGSDAVAVGWKLVSGPSASGAMQFVPGQRETGIGIPVRDVTGSVAGQLMRRPAASTVDIRRAAWLIGPAALALAAVLAGLGWMRSRRRPTPEAVSDTLPERGPSMAVAAASALQKLHESHGNLALLRIRINDFDDLCRRRPAAIEDLVSQLQARMRLAVRAGDILRYEGHGLFSVLQVQMDSLADAQNVAHRLVEAAEAPPAGDESDDLPVALSIGIAVAPQNGRTLPLLIDHADQALEKTGADERFRYAFCDRRVDEEAKLRDIVEQDLAAAIGTDQITLHYQPIYSPDGVHMLGVEALVRWFHPELGFIPPTHFIPIAEERGVVVKLGLWALRRACEDGLRWPKLTVAVNVSPVQFRAPNFVQAVLGIVEETGFDPWRLELELTEGVVVADPELAEMQMMELRSHGIRMALDDFGTGYSSLIYLRRFAIDKIKIDRSFLESMETTGEAAILVHSVVHLGRALGLTVTAEGVETPDQHRFLQAAGCHQLQGYLFSHPVSADEIDRLLALALPRRERDHRPAPRRKAQRAV